MSSPVLSAVANASPCAFLPDGALGGIKIRVGKMLVWDTQRGEDRAGSPTCYPRPRSLGGLFRPMGTGAAFPFGCCSLSVHVAPRLSPSLQCCSICISHLEQKPVAAAVFPGVRCSGRLPSSSSHCGDQSRRAAALWASPSARLCVREFARAVWLALRPKGGR